MVSVNIANAAPADQIFDAAGVGDKGTQSYTLDGVIYTTNDSGALNISIVNDGNIASGADLALGFRSSGANNTTQVGFKTSDGSEFKLMSFVASTGLGDVTVTVKGYRDNAEVASSSFTTASYTTFDVSSDSNWENIDEVRMTGADLDLDIDDLDFATAIGNSAPVYNISGLTSMATIAEDIADADNNGTTIANIINSSAANSNNAITDADAGALEGLAVTAVKTTTAQGTWQYKTGAGAWTDMPDLTADSQASMVLGQTSYTSYTGGTGANKFGRPFGMVIDPVSNKLFVADGDNNRVLRFASYETLVTNSSAEAVFGQADFDASDSDRGER